MEKGIIHFSSVHTIDSFENIEWNFGDIYEIEFFDVNIVPNILGMMLVVQIMSTTAKARRRIYMGVCKVVL